MMKDFYDLIESRRVDPNLPLGQRITATVIHTEGHAYRRTGARLLIQDAKKIFGTISGGCLEESIVLDAERMPNNCSAKRVEYDSRNLEDLIWGNATGCGGSVSVLLQRWNSKTGDLLAWADERLTARQPVVLATIIQRDHPQTGRQIAIDSVGEMFSQIELEPIQQAEVVRMAELLFQPDRRPKLYHYRRCVVRRLELLFEYIPPKISLLIFGAGDDAPPVVDCAKRLGWLVTVIDHRPGYLQRHRLPFADQLLLADPETYASMPHPDPLTIAVVMTHNWHRDAAAIAALSHFDLPYVGIIGNAERAAKILRTISNGNGATKRLSKAIHCPAGLDIGAETPEEIALAVVSEIQAVLKARVGASLSSKKREGLRTIFTPFQNRDQRETSRHDSASAVRRSG